MSHYMALTRQCGVTLRCQHLRHVCAMRQPCFFGSAQWHGSMQPVPERLVSRPGGTLPDKAPIIPA